MLNLPTKSKLAGCVVAALLQGCGSSSEMPVNSGAIPDPSDIAAALGEENTEFLSLELSGAQTIPTANTRQTGTASFTLDNTTSRLSGIVNTAVGNVTSVHLHEGSVGEVGAQVATLMAESADQYRLPAMTVLSAQQAASFRSGDLYIDVHTQSHPAGELRAQLSDEVIELSVLPAIDDIQAKIFTPVCSGCHTGGGISLPSVMDLSSAEASYAALVGVSSISAPELLRVEPGVANSSFLVNKVEGTQTVGSRMPFRGKQLEASSLQAIRQWVATGAAR